MSQKLPIAVPRLASTILLLAQNPHHNRTASGGASSENDIHVLMMKRHSKARFMPSVYVFPGGGVDVADYTAAQRYVSTHFNVSAEASADAAAAAQTYLEAKINPTLAEAETEAWACRVGALRELSEEAACVLQRDGSVCTAAQWQAWRAQQQPPQRAAAAAAAAAEDSVVYDVDATPLLRPVGRWVTPRHFKYRYDTFFYAALVKGAAAAGVGLSSAQSPLSSPTFTAETTVKSSPHTPAQDLPLMAQASEVADLLWVSPLQALRRHENGSDTFSLAPPTFLLLHALAKQPSYAALAETWATTLPAPAPCSDAPAPPVGTLPYYSAMPCVEPRSHMTQDKKYIQDFMLPENYLYEKGWSEPAGAYRFCGEAFDDQTHDIRMWVGADLVEKVKAKKMDVASVMAQHLVH